MARVVGVTALLVVLLGLCVTSVARAESSVGSYAEAMSECQAFESSANPANYGYPNAAWIPCYAGAAYGGGYEVYADLDGAPSHINGWRFPGNPPDPGQTCSGRPEIVLATDSGTTYSNAGCVYAPYGDASRMTCIDNSGTHYCTGEIHMRPTGDNTVASPPAAADPVPPLPKVCGGGSCYDPTSQQYCAATESGQVCVSSAAAASGGCATTGASTLCAGTIPPLPPKISVPDPATQLVGTDTYRVESGYGSSSQSTGFVTVNNYNTSGAAPSSGKGSGDTGPDTTPQDSGDKTTASGGGSCTSPPLVEGNAAVAAVAQQVWLARCQGDGGSSNDADTSVPGISNISESGQGLVADGGDIFSKLDFSGLAGGGTGTCPAPFTLQLARYGIDYEETPEQWCDMLHAVGVMIEWFAVVASLVILGRR